MRRCLFLVGLLLSLPAFVWANGKIIGKITDANTGDPLIGVNVIIEGLGQGNVTNADGEYVIINVRPGEYTLVISYVGYQTQRITGVRVVTDQTTRLDINLREEVIEGQEIVVQAERPLIQKDLTASKKTVIAEEIEVLPVETIFGILTTQAGISQGAGGELHIRGGRSNEIAYMVDGLSVGNPFNTNGLATLVANNAIQELTVVSGAFNAEYGQAMSGIVNLVTKEGGSQYEGSFSTYFGDYATSHSDVFWTPSNLNANNQTYEGTLSGPLPGLRDVNFFLSGRYSSSDGTIFGVRQHLPSDSANFNATPWYYEISGTPVSDITDPSQIPNEIVAMNPSWSYNITGKLTTRPMTGVKVEYSALLDGGWRRPFNFAYRYNPDGVASNRDNSVNHSIKWTHTLNPTMFYTLRASYATNSFKSFLYENPQDPRYVSTGRIVGFPGINFLFGGNQKGHVYEDSRSFRGKLDFTKQFGTLHEAKVGLDWQLHGLDRENFVVLFDGNRYREPTVLPADQSPSHDVYTDQRVIQLSAYAQDKLEFEDFIINIGVRYDRFEPRGQFIPDLLNPIADPLTKEVELAEASPKNMVSPRVGISFPITARGVIHLSYGHFYQMPTLRNMYVNPEWEFPAGSVPTFGNPNLRPERTILYEIGLQQQIGDHLAFDVTGYFKDIRDYLALQRVQFSTIPGENLYAVYLNNDYASVKGIAFALTKRRAPGQLLSANLDYTFQIAEGNRTDGGAFFFNSLSGRENELEVIPLSFDQRHILSATVSLTKPNNWGLSFIGQFATGYPYSPLIFDQNIDLLPNSGRKPSQIKLDVRFFKTVQLGEVNLMAFAKIFNVLDRLNERFVFNDTGRATYSLSDQRNIHAAWEPFYGQPGIYTLNDYNTRPHYYSSPRLIQLGLTVSF